MLMRWIKLMHHWVLCIEILNLSTSTDNEITSCKIYSLVFLIEINNSLFILYGHLLNLAEFSFWLIWRQILPAKAKGHARFSYYCNVQNFLSAQAEAQVVLVFVPALCMHFSCNALLAYRLDRSTDQQKILLKGILLKAFLSRVTGKKIRLLSFLIR